MKNKLLIVILLVAGFSNLSYSQTLSWNWAAGSGGLHIDNASGVCADADGNIFVTGSFRSSSLTFGSYTLTNSDPSGNYEDFFLVKYSSSGNVLWAVSAGGSSFDLSRGIATDADGNVFITGSYYSPVLSFGGISLNNVDSEGNTTDIFIAKYSPTGSLLWAKSAGGTGHDIAYGCATDYIGSVLITGSFSSSTIAFDSHTLNNINFSDIFVTKYSSTGNVSWATGAGGSSFDEALGISMDSDGNALITGNFSSPTLNFGNIMLTNFDVSSTSADIFIAKFDSLGNTIWAVSAGKGGMDYGRGIAFDAEDNVLVTGYFTSYILTFGSITINNSNSSYEDIFVVKFSPDGDPLWAASAGANDGNDRGYGITVDAAGNVFVTGAFASSAPASGAYNLTGNGGNDLFVAKYSTTGEVLWAIGAGGILWDEAYGISSTMGGNILIAGAFYSPTLSFGSNDLTNAGSADIFVAQLASTTGVEVPFTQGKKITISPNPFKTLATLKSDKPLINAKLTIYNSFGQVIKEFEGISGTSITLDRDSLANGIYFICLIEDDYSVTDKLVIAD
jgi:hypothetical protein